MDRGGHRTRLFFAGSAVLLCACCLALPAVGEEPVIEFLRAAQKAGYGEVAIDYLEQLAKTKRLPKSLKDTWDLELSRSYRVSVGESFNAAEAEARLAKAQEHLDKFLKEHPEHEEVAAAMESWGDITLDRALAQLRAAASVNDEALKARHFAEARLGLEAARPRFADAEKRYRQRFDSLKQAQGGSSKRPKAVALLNRKQRAADDALREAELAWLDCTFKAAKIDFYKGQTYLDSKSPERKAAFEAAAKAFDTVFQSYRESLVGLHAHLWNGRAADEMGNDTLALDIYDEVLATAPEGREQAAGLEPLFAQAMYHRLLVVRRLQGFKQFLQDAEEWLQLRRTWKRLDAYQGVALEVAKTQLEHADELAPASKKEAFVRSVLASLAEIGKTRSEYQQAAILLRRRFASANPQDVSQIKSFDEAVAVGDGAAESLDWPTAVAALERAMELSKTIKDVNRVNEAQTRLDQARYQLATAHYGAGKTAECLTIARQIIDRQPESPLAPLASSLAISAALAQYAQAEDKPPALETLKSLAQQTITRWPDKAEADDARIALGQISLVQGDAAAALKVFENVNPRSARRPLALSLAGQTHWRQYLMQKSKSAEQAAAERTKALEQLQASLEAQRKEADAQAPLPRQVVETQLLVGEILAEGGQHQQSVELLAPLVAGIQAQKPEAVDNTILRIMLAATRSQLALGQADQAFATANALAELSPDGAAGNGVLVSIFRLFGDRWRQAEAAVIEANTAGDNAKREAATAAANQIKQLVNQLATKLAARKELTLAARIYLADTCADLGQTDTARDLYQAILAQGESDPEFKKANAAALTRIQSQLVGLLRRKGEFAEGLKQVDLLIAAFPNALEPKMEKGRLLQSWADSDPTKSADAVAHWTMLRTRLSRAPKKPPEYFEVVFNAANCLYADGQKTRSAEKALQAEQLLNATLVLSPRLSGPEMVARYKDLLQKARQLQGRQ